MKNRKNPEMVVVGNIGYSVPDAILLNEMGIGSAEFAGRIAYDSFEYSEHDSIKELNDLSKIIPSSMDNKFDDQLITIKTKLNSIESSDLLDNLAWVYHHHSVIEHCNLTFAIFGISRGVLQELARHRIVSFTVRSTRYTMHELLMAFLVCIKTYEPRRAFQEIVKSFNMFVTDDNYNTIEIDGLFNKLMYQLEINQEEFKQNCLSKQAFEFYDSLEGMVPPLSTFEKLKKMKKKRNVGDAFKHLVTDNWKTDLVMTINLRSLKNFFELRDSGAAYFLIRELAKKMKKITPKKYLSLMVKEFRNL
jgi:thymidylate synthase (FAD)